MRISMNGADWESSDIDGQAERPRCAGSARVNTALSGSGRVDDIKGHPQGEIRGLTKLVNITEDVRNTRRNKVWQKKTH
jgi:hypothetical protein